MPAPRLQLRPVSLADGWRGSLLHTIPPELQRPWRPAHLPPVTWATFDPLSTEGAGVLKRDAASLVLARGHGGLPIVVKRSLVRRPFLDVRPPRAARAFGKTLSLMRLGLPTEVPVLLARRGRDAVGMYARVPGTTLADVALDTLADRRETMRRLGRVLRETADLGWTHLDAKSTNWIITPNGDPIMLDCDGLRRALVVRRPRRGLDRLLRALREHRDYRLDDEQAVLSGFGGVAV